MGEQVNVGIIGCGVIIAQYLETFARLGDVRLVAVADLDAARARAVADSAPGTLAQSVDELIANPLIEVVVNLTIPAAHAEVSLRIIAAGKAVYVEKPLAASTVEGRSVLDAAEAAGVFVGCAPDTVLGAGIQTARKAIDDGLIGAPIAATATMVTPGHERWHPNPDFYYAPGGGPLLDMGPYYVTSLVTLLGPVVRVVGLSSATRSSRVIGSGPRTGEVVPVTTPTHITGVLEHESGVLSTLLMSFDAVGSRASRIEVHGETGSMVVPDPNTFGGDVELMQLGDAEWRMLEPSAGYLNASRGYGVADMLWSAGGSGGSGSPDSAGAPAAKALGESTASGALGYHVLDIMESLLRAAETGASVAVASTVVVPPPVELSSR